MSIEIVYSPTFADYLKVVRHVTMKRLRFFWLILLAVPIMVFLFSVMTDQQKTTMPTPALVVELLPVILLPAIIIAFIYGSIYFAGKKQWSRAAELREQRTFIFSEGGITVRGSSFSSQNNWSVIREASKFRDIFLLQTNQRAYYIIPERCFSSAAQLQEFISLIKGKLKGPFRI